MKGSIPLQSICRDTEITVIFHNVKGKTWCELVSIGKTNINTMEMFLSKLKPILETWEIYTPSFNLNQYLSYLKKHFAILLLKKASSHVATNKIPDVEIYNVWGFGPKLFYNAKNEALLKLKLREVTLAPTYIADISEYSLITLLNNLIFIIENP